MLALDYRTCGRHGEPTVVHVNQENGFAITLFAENFEAFVTGLVDESVYDTPEQDRLAALTAVRDGSFSPILLRAFREVADVLPDADRRMLALTEAVIHDKRFFALHADARSMLMQDCLLWLFAGFNQVRFFEQYVRTPPRHERSYTLPNYAGTTPESALATSPRPPTAIGSPMPPSPHYWTNSPPWPGKAGSRTRQGDGVSRSLPAPGALPWRRSSSSDLAPSQRAQVQLNHRN